MRTSALLLGTSFTFLIGSLAASAASSGLTAIRGSSGAPGTNPTQFVIAPFTSGSQELFSASIININTANLNSIAGLSGNNAGSAPQGGVGVRQGGLGFATVGLAVPGGVTPATQGANPYGNANMTSSSTGFSSANNSGGLSSAGFSSINNSGGTSSAGFSSINNSGGTSSAGFSSINNSGGTSSAGFSSANNTSGSSSVGQNSQNFSNSSSVSGSTTSVAGLSTLTNSSSGNRPVLVLSSLINSTNPRFGSTGAVFQGISNTQISTVSFQYGTLGAPGSQLISASGVAPVLVVDDQPSGSFLSTRFIPISAGTISNSNNGSGLTTVSFNANQMGLSGPVQRIGISLSQRGVVVVDNITVNGAPPSGILARAQASFPF
ncbi:MAG: hypothetical protein U0103_07715 [Candidatus Obscuribacterales bacterium]